MVMIVFEKECKGKKLAGWSQSLQVGANVDELCQFGKKLFQRYCRQTEIILDIKELENILISCEEAVGNIALGLKLADYRFDKYQSLKKEDFPDLEQAVFLVDDPQAYKQVFKDYEMIANGVRYAKDLFNEPEEQFDNECLRLELKRLEYLGLKVSFGPWLQMRWPGAGKDGKEEIIVAKNRRETAVAAGIFKIRALLKCEQKSVGYFNLSGDELEDAPKGKYIGEINSEQDVEAKVLRFWKEIKNDEN